MGTRALPSNATAEEDERRKPIQGQGVGGVLVLVGCGLIYSESSMGASSGAGLGLLLLLLGWGLIIPGQPEDRSTP